MGLNAPNLENAMNPQTPNRPVRDELLKARVSRQIKQQFLEEALAQGLSPSEAVRQAVAAWVKRAKRAA